MSELMCDSLWRASAPKGPELSPLTEDLEVDVVIIGGGFTGLSTALHLAKVGKKVVVVEAKEIGFGGSGRNVGLANAGVWLEPNQLDAALGREAGGALYDMLGKGPDYVYGLIEQYQIECEPVRKGTLHAGVGKQGLAQLQRRYQQMAERGSPVKLLTASEAQQRIGSKSFNSALFDPRAGTIQPMGYARGLAHAALKEGAQLFDQSPVVGIEKLGSRWQICVANAKVMADQVVLAANAYADFFLKPQERKFVPISYSQMATKPLSASELERILPGKEGLWDTCMVMSSFRLDNQGRLIFGGMGNTGTMHTDWAKQRLKDLYPFLSKVEFEYFWSGKIAYSDDHLPHCQVLDQGLFSVSGYSGRGICTGTLMGKELAELLAGQRSQTTFPMDTLGEISMREMKRVFYEVSAHTYHYGQRTHVLG
ncbi:NAD(P)/FAD-dependent oxidoreductase [Marinomonas fungiae]|uniref:Glycine/D-amino acid oxidase (Deaminating) n=1 Tax=Marinomonas fungiae TaxID=1137284 RepID=A0A0K6IHZ2_9GAMM|nr:FAD-binding oxidoreductase [Marinomonas fungiae]CUB02681.1 Glycine/D-amino acid oxidase (deaminating) [Marinomonas fungiae]